MAGINSYSTATSFQFEVSETFGSYVGQVKLDNFPILTDVMLGTSYADTAMENLKKEFASRLQRVLDVDS